MEVYPMFLNHHDNGDCCCNMSLVIVGILLIMLVTR
jgi:hypothetical protein